MRSGASSMIQAIDVTKITYAEPPPPYPGLPSVQLPDPPTYHTLPGSTNSGSTANLSTEPFRPYYESALPLKR
ncbi:unnamed protein product [Anisakis simplex]|uniref:LIM domain-binding protein 3 n=1 Tax=Anisakis simplex TaxID=6269 RepID=A0A0M3J1Y5_ANISI|nr:unnamed protein product [Anisakis simplex]